MPLLHGLLYHLTWLATLYGWLHERVWLGPCLAAGYILMVWGIRRLTKRLIIGMLAFTGLGGFIEGLHQLLGIVVYQPGLFPPWWILPLWAVFVFFIVFSVQGFGRTFWLAAILGAVFGPLTYGAVARAAGQVPGIPDYLFLSVEWGILFPLLIWAGGRWLTKR